MEYLYKQVSLFDVLLEMSRSKLTALKSLYNELEVQVSALTAPYYSSIPNHALKKLSPLYAQMKSIKRDLLAWHFFNPSFFLGWI